MKATPLSASEATTKRIFRLIVAGGRTYDNRTHLYNMVDYFLQEKVAAGWTIEIYEGGCRRYDDEGNELPTADSLARDYARERGYLLETIPADWKHYGKAAGPRRNRKLAARGHALLAFWNKKSPGTGNMITLARNKGLPVRVVHCTY